MSTGTYLFEPIIFDYIESGKKVSLENDIFPKLAERGLLWGYFFEGYFMDIGRPETYSQFKKDVLETLFLNKNSKVKDAMNKIERSETDLVLIIDENKKLLGILNNKIIRNYLITGGDINDGVENCIVRDPLTANINDKRSKIQEILLAGTHKLPILDNFGKVVDVEFHIEKIKTEKYPVIRGKSPLRVSFAGGGTDLPSFFEKYGGIVINGTINKYCHATIIKRADTKIIISSDMDMEKDMIIDSVDQIVYDGKFDLIKAAIKIMEPDFGFEVYLHNDIPPGRGLGSSASLSVLIVSMLSNLQETNYDEYKIAKIAHKIETEELGIKGGLQDQYSTVSGGFNFMEFTNEKTIIYPLKLKDEVINELNEHIILCYVGESHFSGDQQNSLQMAIDDNENKKMNYLNELKKIAVEIKDCLLTNNLEKIGEYLHESWIKKRTLSQNMTNPKIDILYEVGRKNGAYGGKLLGSGGGGYIMFFCSPLKINHLKKVLSLAGGEIMDFSFEFNGTKVWPVKNKF